MYLPKLGPHLPRRGNGLSRWLGRMLMRLCRWHVEGEIDQSAKLLLVMAPHTSWWDFTMNFGVLLAMGLRASWFIASKYTGGFIGGMLRVMGAVPVERSVHSDMVGQMTGRFAAADRFVLAIFPEGTRKPVAVWKSGFWHIAKQAGVPVQLVAVDYARRATVFGPVIDLSDDKEQDIRRMRAYFHPAMAKRPGNALYDAPATTPAGVSADSGFPG